MVSSLATLLLFATEVWIFVRTDCPISNRYAPTIAKLQQEFAPHGVTLKLIYPEPGASQQTIDLHKTDYGLQPIPALLDTSLTRARRAGVRVTPEAVVFDDAGKIIYRGRIDDRQASLRIARPPTKQDLRETLLHPPLRPVTTRAIGCAIEGLP
jgi:thiol-disulfide isomerase/thioredoxin